jgi:hypothetical protein
MYADACAGVQQWEGTQTQRIPIAPQTLLISTIDGRSWLLELRSSSLAALKVSAVAAERSTLAASAVEGAIGAGLMQSANSSSNPSFSLQRYIRWLVGNYVFAGQTPGLFRRAAERFAALERSDLAEFALQKAKEETGHAELAYRDLEALELPAADVIRLIEPPSARIFAARFRAYVEGSDPIALFGFSYCMERMAVERDDALIEKIRVVCPPEIRAFRFLKVHSSVGSDGAHVDEQLSFFESLTYTELKNVACAAFETGQLLARQPLMDEALSDAEIDRRLRAAGIKQFPRAATLRSE